MRRTPKGCSGYIRDAVKAASVRTAVAFVLCVAPAVYGYVSTGSEKNVFSLVAAAMFLPFGVFAVNLVMFLRAKPCSKEACDTIEAAKGLLPVLYDLTLTGRDHDFKIASAVAFDRQILCYTEDELTDETLLKNHLREQMAYSDYRELQISLFRDVNAYAEKLRELDDIRAAQGADPLAEEDNWQPGTVQTMTGILKSISL